MFSHFMLRNRSEARKNDVRLEGDRIVVYFGYFLCMPTGQKLESLNYEANGVTLAFETKRKQDGCVVWQADVWVVYLGKVKANSEEACTVVSERRGGEEQSKFKA